MWRQVHTCLLFDMIERVMPRSLLCIVWDGVLFPVSLRSQRDPIFTEWWECLTRFCALKRSRVNCIGAFDWRNCIQSSSYISKHWSNPCVLDLVQRSIRIRPPENLISSTFIDESVPCYCWRVRARTPILNMSVCCYQPCDCVIYSFSLLWVLRLLIIGIQVLWMEEGWEEEAAVLCTYGRWSAFCICGSLRYLGIPWRWATAEQIDWFVISSCTTGHAWTVRPL